MCGSVRDSVRACLDKDGGRSYCDPDNFYSGLTGVKECIDDVGGGSASSTEVWRIYGEEVGIRCMDVSK
ncbi:MAG: hypothetical protein ABIH78_02185 [Candidatus Peregrinibacteria bacterium]